MCYPCTAKSFSARLEFKGKTECAVGGSGLDRQLTAFVAYFTVEVLHITALVRAQMR
jgi:hypothetical protein